jgi:hypothetical protein
VAAGIEGDAAPLWLDITILFRTIASPRAYRNAC